MFISHLLVAFHLIISSFGMAPVTAQKVPVSPFSSVELRGGGKVTLRYGPTQQVTFIKGSQEYSNVSVSGGMVVIENCKSHCPKGYSLEVDIVTPQIAKITVSDGGTIESRGNFPIQAEMSASVRDGGTIDIRSIVAERVSASVYQGGRILTNPSASMVALVNNGGQITYWSNAYVQSSVESGGIVAKGEAADAEKPLSELKPSLPPPPVPPVPPVKPHPVRR